jgi:DNA polymerase-3 subunit epsilon
MKHLKLDRPIVSFDLETTGIDTENDYIVQFNFTKIYPNGDINKYTRLVKPPISIPGGASEVHGITDEKVKYAKPFSYYAPKILAGIKGCYLAGYNTRRFDVPLLARELERNRFKDHDLYEMDHIDVMVLYGLYRPKTLVAAVMDLCGYDLEGAHDAEADVLGTIDVLDALAKHWEVDNPMEMAERSKPEGTADFAGKLFKDESGFLVYNIGKDKGKRIVDEPGFGRWMLNKDFPEQTKSMIRKELRR